MGSTPNDMRPLSAESLRRAAESRRLRFTAGLLLLTTVLVAVILLSSISLVLLMCVPFVLFVAAIAAVAPLAGRDKAEDAAQRRMHLDRQALAQRHSMPAPADKVAAQSRERRHADHQRDQAAMARAEAAHGIHFGCAAMPDDDFVQSFHDGEIRAADFHHGDHLRYAWLMLHRVPASLAEETIAQNLRTYLRKVCGGDQLFHATRTHAWVSLLRAEKAADFAALLDTGGAHLTGASLHAYYTAELLDSAEARKNRVVSDTRSLPNQSSVECAAAVRPLSR